MKPEKIKIDVSETGQRRTRMPLDNQEKKSRIFLASPYTHEDKEVINVRYQAALKATGNLLSEGCIIFSPIIHCHLPAKIYCLPKDHKFWAAYNDSFLYHWAEVLYVLCLKDWEDSKGVTREVNIAKSINLPIYYRTL